MTYDVGTVFPGYMTMLPVLATVLVIVAGGTGGSARGPVVVLRHPVALWIGRHSYAIYLWHWPVLVLAEAEYGPLPLPTRLLLVALAVGLSAVSLRLVEDPVRHSPWLAGRAMRGLVLGGTLCATAVLAGAWMRSADTPLDSGELAAAPTLAPQTTVAPQQSPRVASGGRARRQKASWPCLKATSNPSLPPTVRCSSRGSRRPTCHPTCARRSATSVPIAARSTATTASPSGG